MSDIRLDVNKKIYKSYKKNSKSLTNPKENSKYIDAHNHTTVHFKATNFPKKIKLIS